MSERKVLNKYYPPDFDPSKIPKGKRNRNATFNIRIMAPFNMRCNTCKDYIYKGKKFNSRKEDVMDEDYLGLKIFRFYIKCPRCVSEIAFKTDLQNTDYTLEAGATRLFEAEKIAQKMAEQERKEKEEDEMNPMKLLENRTKASRMEMEQIDALEELRELNSRKNVFNTDEMIEKYRKYEETLQQLQMEQEEKEIQDIFGAGSTKVVKRLHDSDSEDEGPAEKKVATEPAQPVKPTDILSEVKKETKARPQQSWEKSVGSMTTKTSLKGLIVKKKTTTLPVVISKPKSDNIQSVSDLESSLHNVVKTSDPISVNSNTAVNSAVDKEKMAGSDRTDQNSESGEKETKNSSNSAEVAQPKSVGLGSLGLLGNYSDSESDVSE